MDEYDDTDDKLFVIVEWDNGAFQIRDDCDSVLKYVKMQQFIKSISDPMTIEEAFALFKMYPKDKRLWAGTAIHYKELVEKYGL